MKLRDATPMDCGHLVLLLQRACAESAHPAPPIDEDKARHVFMKTAEKVGNPDLFMRVVEGDGRLVAMAMAERAESLWYTDQIVFGHHIYAEAAVRGTHPVGRLMWQLHQWAFSKPAVVRFDSTAGMGQSADTVFTKMGLQPAGAVYGARVG